MKQAILVIDVQKIYTDHDSEYYIENESIIIDNINKIIKKHAAESLVVYIAHKNKPDGSDSGRMYDYSGESGEVEFADNSPLVDYDNKLLMVEGVHIVKTKYDSFIETSLLDVLKKNDIEKVVIVGFMTNFCCESTARTAHDLGFYVDFVKDATGTPGTSDCSPEELIKTTCSSINNGFGLVVNTEEIL